MSIRDTILHFSENRIHALLLFMNKSKSLLID